MLRRSAIFAFSVLIGVSAFGQSGTQWRTRADVVEGVRGTIVGTVADLEPGQNRFTLTPDDDRNGTVTVDTDAVSTQFNGFGGTINGAPEVFVGSTGYSNVRLGDRVEVRGTGRAGGIVGADYITLLGRPVPASQTGVGQTRTPDRISPPTASGTTPAGPTPQTYGPVEGVVRQVNATDGRVVIQTDRNEMITVRGTNNTPVYYRNNVYRIGNLEPGDRIRIQPDAAASVSGELRARTIDVVQNVEESGSNGATVQVGGLTGRVVSIDRRANNVRVQNDRGENVLIDLTNALDTDGRRVRAADMQAGDHVDLSGSYVGDVFVATTVRYLDENGTPAPPADAGPAPAAPLGAVTIYGNVTQSLANGPRVVVRDQAGGAVPLYVTEDFVVRTRTGGYMTADKLREGDAVVVKAYRDSDGNYIAQTIRLR
ncbi:MAG TPA: hypothetical protein VJ853_09345 [Thermoanaerobaculia bacterium]|nr:hypothetical protein [Thermoanaerobaculia bacterium]